MRVRAGLTALATVVVVAAVGCTSGGEGGARPSAAATATTAHHATTPNILAADASPREVRARFEQLLGQHALLAVRLGRSEVAMDPDLQKVVETSLAANAGALRQLGRRWPTTTPGPTASSSSGRATPTSSPPTPRAPATGNSAGVQEARAALLAHCDDWGAWLEEASGGRVEAGAGDPDRPGAGRAAHGAGRRLRRPGLRQGLQAGAPGLPGHLRRRDHAGLGQPHHQGGGRPGQGAGEPPVGLLHAAGRAHGADRRRPAGHLRRVAGVRGRGRPGQRQHRHPGQGDGRDRRPGEGGRVPDRLGQPRRGADGLHDGGRGQGRGRQDGGQGEPGRVRRAAGPLLQRRRSATRSPPTRSPTPSPPTTST